jgi:hypothetical protein
VDLVFGALGWLEHLHLCHRLHLSLTLGHPVVVLRTLPPLGCGVSVLVERTDADLFPCFESLAPSITSPLLSRDSPPRHIPGPDAGLSWLFTCVFPDAFSVVERIVVLSSPPLPPSSTSSSHFLYGRFTWDQQ